MGFVYSLGGNAVATAFEQYLAIALTANVELSWATQWQNVNLTVAINNDVTPTADGYIVKLPDARDASVGTTVLFNNTTGFTFVLNKNDNTALISPFPASKATVFILIDNSTQGGSWRQYPYSAGGGAVVTSIAATSSSNNLTIGGSPITTSGTFTFGLANDLLALSSFGSAVGSAFRTTANTWSLRTLTGTSNQITVTDGDGVAGPPTFSLPTTVTGISSLTAGNILISSNSITSTNSNGNITLSPQGTGLIQFSNNTELLVGSSLKFYSGTNPANYFEVYCGNTVVNQTYTWPVTTPTAGQVLSVGGSLTDLQWSSVTTFGGPSTTNAIAKYLNTSGSLNDSGILIDSSNNVTGALSITAGNISVGVGTTNTIASTNLNGNIILTPSGTGQVQGPVGQLGLPAYTFSGDTDTGMWHSAANEISFSANGAAMLTLSVGQVQAIGASAITPGITFIGDTDTGFYRIGANTIGFATNGVQVAALDALGNLGIGTATFGTSAAKVLGLFSGTAPSTGPADTLQLYSSDLSAGNTMLSWFGEGTSVASVTPTSQNRTIAVRVNGTIYFLTAKTSND